MAANPLTDFRFHGVSLAVAAVAGVATYGTTAVMLPASAMFLGWVAFNLAGTATRDNLANIASFLIGLALGIGTAISILLLTPTLGAAATPLAVSGVVILVLSLRTMAPLNNPIAYFLGLTSFFYSSLAPTVTTYAILASAAVIGAASCAAATLLQTFVQPQTALEA